MARYSPAELMNELHDQIAHLWFAEEMDDADWKRFEATACTILDFTPEERAEYARFCDEFQEEVNAAARAQIDSLSEEEKAYRFAVMMGDDLADDIQ